MLGRLINRYPILQLDFAEDGDVYFLDDRDRDASPRYVRVVGFDDDLQTKNKFETKSGLRLIELRGVGNG